MAFASHPRALPPVAKHSERPLPPIAFIASEESSLIAGYHLPSSFLDDFDLDSQIQNDLDLQLEAELEAEIENEGSAARTRRRTCTKELSPRCICTSLADEPDYNHPWADGSNDSLDFFIHSKTALSLSQKTPLSPKQASPEWSAASRHPKKRSHT